MRTALVAIALVLSLLPLSTVARAEEPGELQPPASAFASTDLQVEHRLAAEIFAGVENEVTAQLWGWGYCTYTCDRCWLASGGSDCPDYGGITQGCWELCP